MKSGVPNQNAVPDLKANDANTNVRFFFMKQKAKLGDLA